MWAFGKVRIVRTKDSCVPTKEYVRILHKRTFCFGFDDDDDIGPTLSLSLERASYQTTTPTY